MQQWIEMFPDNPVAWIATGPQSYVSVSINVFMYSVGGWWNVHTFGHIQDNYVLEQKIKDTNKENKGELKKTHRRNERTVSSYNLVKKKKLTKRKRNAPLDGCVGAGWKRDMGEMKNKGRWRGSDEWGTWAQMLR